MNQIYVKPASVPVKDPHGQHIPSEGCFVPHDHFWAIRLLHGDVVLAEAPGPTPEPLPDPVADPAAVLPPRKRRGA